MRIRSVSGDAERADEPLLSAFCVNPHRIAADKPGAEHQHGGKDPVRRAVDAGEDGFGRRIFALKHPERGICVKERRAQMYRQTDGEEQQRREKAAGKSRGEQEAVFAHNGFVGGDVARVFAAVKFVFGLCAAGHDGGKREKRRGDDRAEKRMNQRKQRRNDDQQRSRHGKRVPRVDLLVLKDGLHAAVQLFEHAGQLLLKCGHGHIQTERENNGGRQGECAHRIPP